MLRFASPPDPVFKAILNAALDMVQDEFEEECLNDEDKAQFWKAQYPNAAKVFSVSTSKTVVTQVANAHSQPILYDLTDYHWLLLHDILQTYVEIHNDLMGEEGGLFPVGPYLVGEIDFDFILDGYFFDTDFLLEKEDVAALGIEGRQALGMNEETFGLTQGLTPHPDELQIRPSDFSSDPPTHPIPPDGSIIRKYPNFEEGGEGFLVFDPPPTKKKPTRVAKAGTKKNTKAKRRPKS